MLECCPITRFPINAKLLQRYVCCMMCVCGCQMCLYFCKCMVVLQAARDMCDSKSEFSVSFLYTNSLTSLPHAPRLSVRDESRRVTPMQTHTQDTLAHTHVCMHACMHVWYVSRHFRRMHLFVRAIEREAIGRLYFLEMNRPMFVPEIESTNRFPFNRSGKYDALS